MVPQIKTNKKCEIESASGKSVQVG